MRKGERGFSGVKGEGGWRAKGGEVVCGEEGRVEMSSEEWRDVAGEAGWEARSKMASSGSLEGGREAEGDSSSEVYCSMLSIAWSLGSGFLAGGMVWGLW